MRTYRVFAGAALAAIGAVVLVARPAAAQAGGFSDVPASHWAAAGVTKMAAAGVVSGDPKQKSAAKPQYNGDRPVTRYELAVTLYKFVQYLEKADQQKRGKSKVEATPTGAEAVKKLIAQGYLPKDTILAKEGAKNVTADQLAAAMASVITQVRAKKIPITPDSLKTQPIENPSHPTDTKTGTE
jgi:hypothetical protein